LTGERSAVAKVDKFAKGDEVNMTRILSLDDEPEMLKLINLILRLGGYEHVHTTSDEQALSILRNEQVDLFTQDGARPDMDGLQFYQLMKADECLRRIPVLFISARQRPEFAAECHATFGDHYLLKPFGPLELLATVAAALKQHGKRTPTEEERTALYKQIRAQLASEWNRTPEQLDAIYAKITSGLAEDKHG
jgi:DNA-binding response OmpR family regulator